MQREYANKILVNNFLYNLIPTALRLSKIIKKCSKYFTYKKKKSNQLETSFLIQSYSCIPRIPESYSSYTAIPKISPYFSTQSRCSVIFFWLLTEENCSCVLVHIIQMSCHSHRSKDAEIVPARPLFCRCKDLQSHAHWIKIYSVPVMRSYSHFSPKDAFYSYYSKDVFLFTLPKKSHYSDYSRHVPIYYYVHDFFSIPKTVKISYVTTPPFLHSKSPFPHSKEIITKSFSIPTIPIMFPFPLCIWIFFPVLKL